MRGRVWPAARAGVTRSTTDSSERRVGIGALREWENSGQYIARQSPSKTRPRALDAPPSVARRHRPRRAGYPHRNLDMSARPRSAVPLALALTVASIGVAAPVRAQETAAAPAATRVAAPAA